MTVQTYPAPKSQVTSSFWRYTATGGETTLTGIDNAGVQLAYLPGQEQVFLNGVMLVRGTDYTATNGTSITGLAALTASDYVQVTTYSNFTVTNIPVSAINGSILNLQLANSSFTIGSTLINLGDTKTTVAGLTLTTPTINNPTVGTAFSTSIPLVVKGASGQAVDFLNIQDSSSNKLVQIDSSGNLGIGSNYSTAPIMEKLDVQGNINFNSLTTTAGRKTNFTIGVKDAGLVYPKATIGFVGESTSTYGILSNITFNNMSGDYYNAGLAERMRINYDGRITFNTVAYATLNPGNFAYDFTNAGAWLKGAITTTGSYGGPISMLDGTTGWNVRLQDNGGTMRFGYGTTTSGITELMQLTNGNVVYVAGSLRSNTFGYSRRYTSSPGAGYFAIGGSGFLIIHGYIGGNEFWDTVLGQFYGSNTTLASATIGSPPTRTYAMNQTGGFGMQITGGTAGTYTIDVWQFN